jgi:membrane associated rhomboid family serine protease
LALDAGAFLLLYSALQKKTGQRFVHTFICGATSFLMIWFCSAKVSDIGFCGLSGIAHGLMTILSLEMIFDSKKFFQSQKSRTGLICFVVIILKCTFELTGNEINTLFHFDLCGNPLYESHIGGVIGGIVSFFILEYRGAGNFHGILLETEEINHAKV